MRIFFQRKSSRVLSVWPGILLMSCMNLALARRGKVIWEEGFGYADLERQIPMTAQTVMHSGSMGKTYTATAIMQL